MGSRIEAAIYEAKRDVRSEAKRLAREAKHLAERMAEVAEKAEAMANETNELPRLDEAKRSYTGTGRYYSTFNSLGEVQGRGADVDLSCARLAEKVERLNYLVWASSDESGVKA